MSHAKCSRKPRHPPTRWQEHLLPGAQQNSPTDIQFRAELLLLRAEVRRGLPGEELLEWEV